MKKSKILVTGATGFIGGSLCKFLSKSNKSVIGTFYSSKSLPKNTNTEYISLRDISLNSNWKKSLASVKCLIHCAGRVHTMNKKKKNESHIYKLENVDLTKEIAEQAAIAGVSRLIFLSSIKVNGETTGNLKINNNRNGQNFFFIDKDVCEPQDSYAKSKLEAEKVLWEISSRSGLEVVILRLPLVYGYGVKGNLARLIKLVRSGIPLPLSLVKNRRSMIGIDNLIDLLVHCIDHPEAGGKTFLASDGEDLSTPKLIKLFASSMGRNANLFPLPIFLLKFLGSVFGKKDEINRLVGSLQIDNSYIKKTLDWTPPISVEEGIKKMFQKK